MLIFKKQSDLNSHLSQYSNQNAIIGFVPTMGALHQGHLSLLRESVANNTLTVISIFVNPTQFDNADDLAKYPRTLNADVEKIRTVSPEIIVFAPSVDDLYEGKTVSSHFDFDGLENQMEGRSRPGHFDGVGTIVKRLFEIVNPTNAYFGEKDFQQLQIIRKLVSKYKIPVNVVGCPIFREANGLAMSSRNERLSDAEKNQASIIYKILLTAKTMFETQNPEPIIEWVAQAFKAVPGFDLDYFEIADETSLIPSKTKTEGVKYRAFIAVFVNKVRLIDTISLN